MAISYDNRKKSYDSMNDSQKQQYNDLLKNKGDDYIGNQYMKQYNSQLNDTPQSNNNSSNPINNNDTNGQNQTNFDTPTVQKNESQNNNQTYNYDPNEKLDTSMFGASDGKVKVQEGTAAQTGMPDYQLDSDARTKEITDNLNAYWQTNREYFSDRNTYNNMFHYNERSDQQKAILDSYWKKKEDYNTASKYTTGDAISNGMKDAEITTDQLNYIKEMSPEAYREWQQKQLDDINLRIANMATPADPTDNAELFNSLVQKLGLEPNDPYQIYDNWYSMCERLGVFSDSEKLKSYQNQLDTNHSKMESIMSRYSASTGGTVSDSLAAARMAKALAPYQQREIDLQNSYTTLLNGRNSNLAIANQSATALAMQAQEDQRVWNQRYQALGFAMTTASYRSPEQQAQLQLQTAQIQNDINLLNQSRLNDLNRYNTYATTKLQNQLNAELTDLSVEDEQQLKANLNNILSDYYKNYGDIIQRSQPQVVDDVIAYAMKNGISVAQALTENFIKPLQNKPEYKQKIASSYGMLSKQSIGTINGRNVIMTTNPNGSISYQFIEDPEEIASTTKPYDLVDSKYMTAAPVSYGYNTLGTFLLDKKTDGTQNGGQCGHFVNDYLEYIGMGRYYDDDLSTKLNSVNSDYAVEGSIAVFDYGHKSSDGINHGHVGIVTKVYEDGSFDVVDSNYDVKNPGKIEKRHIAAGSPSCKGFFDMSKPPSAISGVNTGGKDTTFEWNGNTYDFTKYSGWKDLTDDEWLTVENLLTYQTDPASLPKSGKDNGASNQRVRAAAAAIGRDNGYSERKYSLVKNAETKWDNAALPGGVSSANSTAMSILKSVSDSYQELENYDIQTINSWINAFKTEVGDPTVGAMYTDLRVASSEIAKALKGGASATTEEINSIEKLLKGDMSPEQAKAVFTRFAKNLYEKNESEAKKFYETTGYKPNPIYTDEAAEWMTTKMGIDLSRYYNYESGLVTGPKDEIEDIYASAKASNGSYGSYGGYDADFINQMVNGIYKK